MSVTIKDLARASGVSVATVSYVINNGPRPVHPRTRKRVLAAMEALDYHPNAIARGLSAKRMNTVGVVTGFWVTPDVNFYFAAVLHGILATAQRYRQSTILFALNDGDQMLDEVPFYCDGRCDGLIIFGQVSEEVAGILKRKAMPFVLLHHTESDPDISAIDIDNVAAAQEMVAYLVAQGHRRIAYLDGQWQSAMLRLEGYRRALEEADIAYEESLVWSGDYTIPSGYERTLANMQGNSPNRPTALFCGDDAIALGAVGALRDLGLRVPQDVSVAGFDDISLAANSHPALTTMRQPLGQIGLRAAEMLMDQIEAREAPGRKEFLPTELIVRDSVAPPLV